MADNVPAAKPPSQPPATPTRREQKGEPAKAGWLGENLPAPIGGFGVTFATMFRKVYTEEYPEEKRPTAPRFHGRHQLNRHPDGLEKCVGCELCAWACPADAIYVEGADNVDSTDGPGESGRYSPGERYGRVYQINYLRCIFCGLCIEACPTRALTMTNFYELADDNRADLIFTKDQLLAPLQEGMLAPPHPMAEGMQERDYYQGKVDAATEEQRAWVEQRDAGVTGDPESAGGARTTESAGGARTTASAGGARTTASAGGATTTAGEWLAEEEEVR